MKKKYQAPEIEMRHICLSVDILGLSTFVPEETIGEDIIEEPDLD